MQDISDKPLPMQLIPVGEVHSPIKAPVLTAGESGIELRERREKLRAHHQQVRNTVSELEIFDPWHALLDGIEAFSHILVLYWPHLIDP